MSEEQPNKSKASISHSRLAAKLFLGAVGMFGFGFVLVPIYDVFCEITGLNGKTGGQYAYEAAKVKVDDSRLVTVQFLASNNAGMSWKFEPAVREIQVHPGELTEVSFYAHNTGFEAMVGQAVPSVSPFRAADYLHKTECFCFNQQTLAAGQDIDMPLLFFIDQDIPEDLTKLTLSYTLFDVTASYQQTASNAN
jgi:cytochrome c oxidase assembly protein subunit 11